MTAKVLAILKPENKAGKAANRALQILDFMWEEYQRSYAEKDTLNDTNKRYQRYMQRLSKGDDSMGGRRSVAPNTVHYTSVIRAFSWNVTSKDAPYQAEHLIRQMENQSGIEEFRCLIDSAGHSNNHTSLDKYLNFDRDLIPDRTAYNSLLNAFSRNRAIPVTEKVHAMRQIMKRMEAKAAGGSSASGVVSWQPHELVHDINESRLLIRERTDKLVSLKKKKHELKKIESIHIKIKRQKKLLVTMEETLDNQTDCLHSTNAMTKKSIEQAGNAGGDQRQ
jgi:hypothetical protein